MLTYSLSSMEGQMKPTTALLRSLLVSFAISGYAAAQTTDQFNVDGQPNPILWTLLHPVGDGDTAYVAGGNLEIVVPAGNEHEVTGAGNNAPRVMQVASDPTNFTLVTRLNTGVGLGQEQGIQIWQADTDLLRLEFFGDGTNTCVMQAAVTGGILALDTMQIGLTNISPLYMKIVKAGSTWTLSTSTDSAAGWTEFKSGSFSYPMTVNAVGVYGGNYGGPAPAFTAKFDYFMTSDPLPLPVQLASFTATVANQNLVRLNWSTISETNNYGFYVQKSIDGTSYNRIAGSFQPGHGTTIQPQYYSFTDEATAGNWYYRLEQIDLDNTIHFSDPVQATVLTDVVEFNSLPREFELAQNFPNPFNPRTQIRFDLPTETRVSLDIFNLIGQKVATAFEGIRPAGTHEISFDAASLASGVYLYKLTGNNQTFTRKMILMK